VKWDLDKRCQSCRLGPLPAHSLPTKCKAVVAAGGDSWCRQHSAGESCWDIATLMVLQGNSVGLFLSNLLKSDFCM